MEVELIEIRDFLAAHHPFDQLADDQLAALPGKLEVSYVRRDADILKPGTVNSSLFLIRTGAVEVRSNSGELLARLGEGDVFGYRAWLRGGKVENRVSAIEDTLLYQLPGDEIDRLCASHRQFAYFFEPIGGGRLRSAIESASRVGQDRDTQLNLMTTPIRDLLTREPITLPPDATLCDAARKMRDLRVSSMLIEEQGRLVGILTDRDLRSRVVAENLGCDRPIGDVMTREPLSVDANKFAFEALLLMARRNVHHLPVVDNGRIVGMITATDLTQRHSTSAVYLVGDIYKQTTLEGMCEISAQLPKLLVSLVTADASAASIGPIITAIADAITVRLLQLAEQRLGPPPVPYCWLAAGSQARNEQTAHSDQDNCLFLDDRYDPARHGDYFRRLAEFVNGGLNDCGYVFCPGDVMAKNDQWRQPVAVWKRYFANWIDAPEPKALMYACIFFDLRPLHGDTRLFEEVQRFVLEKTRGHSIFLAYMTGNALTHTPPLGFFRNFVLIRGGEHDHTFDLKHKGVIPVVDLARVYALSAGVVPVNTQERLAAAISGGEVSTDGAMDLRDAFEFIASVRLKHQTRQIQRGEKPDNFVSPDDLSHFERNHLKDAFSVVRTMQSALANRFQAS